MRTHCCCTLSITCTHTHNLEENYTHPHTDDPDGATRWARRCVSGRSSITHDERSAVDSRELQGGRVRAHTKCVRSVE